MIFHDEYGWVGMDSEGRMRALVFDGTFESKDPQESRDHTDWALEELKIQDGSIVRVVLTMAEEPPSA